MDRDAIARAGRRAQAEEALAFEREREAALREQIAALVLEEEGPRLDAEAFASLDDADVRLVRSGARRARRRARGGDGRGRSVRPGALRHVRRGAGRARGGRGRTARGRDRGVAARAAAHSSASSRRSSSRSCPRCTEARAAATRMDARPRRRCGRRRRDHRRRRGRARDRRASDARRVPRRRPGRVHPVRRGARPDPAAGRPLLARCHRRVARAGAPRAAGAGAGGQGAARAARAARPTSRASSASPIARSPSSRRRSTRRSSGRSTRWRPPSRASTWCGTRRRRSRGRSGSPAEPQPVGPDARARLETLVVLRHHRARRGWTRSSGARSILDALGAFVERAGEEPQSLLLEGEAGHREDDALARRLRDGTGSGCSRPDCSAARSGDRVRLRGDRRPPCRTHTRRSRICPSHRRGHCVSRSCSHLPVNRPPTNGRWDGGCSGCSSGWRPPTRVLVAVDDVQWLDAPSARAIAFAAHRLETAPVGLLVALRLEETSRLPIDPERTLPALTRLRVGPLALEDVHRLIRSRLGRTLSRPTLQEVHATSGGNPLYALELARTVVDDPDGHAPGARLVVPTSLRDLVGARIAAAPGCDSGRAARRRRARRSGAGDRLGGDRRRRSPDPRSGRPCGCRPDRRRSSALHPSPARRCGVRASSSVRPPGAVPRRPRDTRRGERGARAGISRWPHTGRMPPSRPSSTRLPARRDRGAHPSSPASLPRWPRT